MVPNAEGEIRILQIMGYLDNNGTLTQKSEEALKDIDGLFRKVKTIPSTDLLGNEYLDKIQQYRNKFPIGKKGDKEDVINKMTRLFFNRPTTTWETVMAAADLYLSEVSESKFVMRANNFLEKNGARTITEYLERIEEGEQENTLSMFRAV